MSKVGHQSRKETLVLHHSIDPDHDMQKTVFLVVMNWAEGLYVNVCIKPLNESPNSKLARLLGVLHFAFSQAIQPID